MTTFISSIRKQFLTSFRSRQSQGLGALVGLGMAAFVGCSGTDTKDGGDGDGGGASASGAGSGVGGNLPGGGGGGNSGGTNPGTGAGTGSGGTVSAGECGRAVGECSAPAVRVTEIDVGVPVTSYGSEGDTAPLPMAIAALPNGGSRVAWLGTDQKVYVGELDCNDQLVGAPFSFAGVNLQDLHADADGGVVLLTRDATGSGEDHCGTGTLCGGESSPCRNMFLVRFDNAGNEVWTRPVTNALEGLDGYQDGARFVWWYQHHGRIAFDGANYGAYFGVAITVQNNACVDIHEGDRMQIVDSSGGLVSDHPDAFEVGCSHAWQSRIVWDPRTSHFVTVCITDNDCRVARPNPYRTVAQGECDGTLFGGDLVLSSTPGYWTAWSQGGQIQLEHFVEAASDTSIDNAGASSHPHLVSYGAQNMLLSWGTDSGLTAQIRHAGTGEVVGTEFPIDVPDHDFQAFKAYADGSVAYPAAGTSDTKLRIARVMACQ